MPDAKKDERQPSPQPPATEPQRVVIVEQQFVPPPATPDLDETHPGGKFLVGGQLVNAGGEPFDEDPAKNLKSAIDASRV